MSPRRSSRSSSGDKADYRHLAAFSRPQALAQWVRPGSAVTDLGRLSTSHNSHDGQTIFVLVAMHKTLR